MTRFLVIAGFVAVVVAGVLAQLWNLEDGPGGTPATGITYSSALPTYGPTEFAGNRACADLVLGRLEIHVFSSGTAEAIIYNPATPDAWRPVSVVWPPRYRSGTGGVIKDASGKVVVNGVGIFENVGACVGAGKTLLLVDLGNPVDPVPAVVANRSQLPSCGIERYTSQRGPRNEAGRRCFLDAYRSGKPAEFETTWPTIEGDPITQIYRVLPGGGVEIFIDSSHDAWAARRGWSRAMCSTLPADENSLDFGPGPACAFTDLY